MIERTDELVEHKGQDTHCAGRIVQTDRLHIITDGIALLPQTDNGTVSPTRGKSETHNSYFR